MTEQTQIDAGPMSPSLEAKLRRFAGDLSAHEATQLLGTAQPEHVAGVMSSPLGEKAQRAAATLTANEETELEQLLERASVAPVGGDDVADVTGMRAAEYLDEYGYKGRPGSSPMDNQVHSGGSIQAAGALMLLWAVGVIGPLALHNNPELGQRTWSNL